MSMPDLHQTGSASWSRHAQIQYYWPAISAHRQVSHSLNVETHTPAKAFLHHK